MILSDYHVHTTFCDGKSTPQEVVLSAIDKNMTHLGFSVHSYTAFDLSYCLKKENIEAYQREINSLKEKYKDKIKIYCGTELDYYSDMDKKGFDYFIGSCHYVKKGDEYLEIDGSLEIFKETVKKFGDDIYEFTDMYYENMGDIINKTRADIIGHFNLVEKYLSYGDFFDTSSERYKKAWQKAADKLIPYGVPFEINTGAISRGYKKEPYPSWEMIDYIEKKGGKFIFSSDSHEKDTLMYEFPKWKDKLKDKKITDILPIN